MANEIRAAGGEAVFNSESVTSMKAVEGMVEQAMDSFGGLHAVINPAGILRDGMFHKMAESDWDRVIEVHLRGTYNVLQGDHRAFSGTRTTAPICLYTSTSGIIGNIGQTNYGAAKMGIAGLSRIIGHGRRREKTCAATVSRRWPGPG